MLKIGQNYGKIANYPPNAQQRSAPLLPKPLSVIRVSYTTLLNTSPNLDIFTF